jgi:hypothetical protein
MPGQCNAVVNCRLETGFRSNVFGFGGARGFVADGFMSAHRLALEDQSVAVVYDAIEDGVGNGSIP